MLMFYFHLVLRPHEKSLSYLTRKISGISNRKIWPNGKHPGIPLSIYNCSLKKQKADCNGAGTITFADAGEHALALELCGH